jgi:sporulation protein YlmC with PRC-barrel domain
MVHRPRTHPSRSVSPSKAGGEGVDPLSRTRGRRVVDSNGIEIGEVEEIFAAPHTGRVRFLRVAAGGILGIGKAFTLIPAEAVVEFDDERILIDLDPDRLLGSPSYLELGRPRWDIPPETPVLAADGEKVGEVVEVHPGFLFVEKGVYFPHDLYIPNDAIALYDGHEVTLKLKRNEISRQGWDEAPPTLVRIGSGSDRALSADERR